MSGGSFQEFNLGPPTEKTVPRFQIRMKRRGSFPSGSVSEYSLAKAALQELPAKSTFFLKQPIIVVCLRSGESGVVSTPRNSGKARAAAREADH